MYSRIFKMNVIHWSRQVWQLTRHRKVMCAQQKEIPNASIQPEKIEAASIHVLCNHNQSIYVSSNVMLTLFKVSRTQAFRNCAAMWYKNCKTCNWCYTNYAMHLMSRCLCGHYNSMKTRNNPDWLLSLWGLIPILTFQFSFRVLL